MGDKWGGKYLRAPDIFFAILKKGEALTERLSRLFEGERYLNTGGADGFFILTEVTPHSTTLAHVVNRAATGSGRPFEGELEQKYLIPLVKDYTREDRRIEIKGHDARCFVVQGEPSRRAADYIRWGEKQGYHLRSVTKQQNPWYKPTNQMLRSAKILVPRSFNDTFVIHYNPHDFLSLRFYRLHPIKAPDTLGLVAYLNSTLIALVLETLGNRSLGQGLLDFFMADFLRLKLPIVNTPDIREAFQALKKRRIERVWEEYGVARAGQRRRPPHPFADRRNLDDVVFDSLKLTTSERSAVYEAVVDLVEARLKKAESLSSKERLKRAQAAERTRGIWAGLPSEEEEEA